MERWSTSQEHGTRSSRLEVFQKQASLVLSSFLFVMDLFLVGFLLGTFYTEFYFLVHSLGLGDGVFTVRTTYEEALMFHA